MRFKVTLNNSAGEIGSETIEIANECADVDEAVNIAASGVIEGWIPSIGDTITIREA